VPDTDGKDTPLTPGATPQDYNTYNTWQRKYGGGGHPAVADYAPWNYGPTFTGLDHLSQVDQQLRDHGIEP
jgi:hypothetical protein